MKDKDTIRKILKMLVKVDGGCSSCGQSVISRFAQEFNWRREEIEPILREVGDEERIYWLQETDFKNSLDEIFDF